MLRLAHRDRFEPEIFADPVLGMHDQVAHAECLQFGQKGVGILALLLAADKAVAEDVLLGQQFHLVIGETGLDRQDHRRGLALGRQSECLLPRFGQLDRRTGFFEDRGDARAAAFRIGREQRALAVLRELGEMLCENGINIVTARALGGEVAARAEPEAHDTIAFGLVECCRAVRGRCGERLAELGIGKVERIGCKRAIIALRLSGDRLALVVIVGNVLHALVGGGQRGLIDHHQIVLAEMIEQRGKLILEQREPVLHARQTAPFADRFVQRVLRGIGAEHLSIAAAEALDAVVIEQCFACGKQQVRIQPPRAHLRIRIESTQALQLVAEEIEPQCLIHAAGKDVDDRAAHGIFALVDHGVGAAIALPLKQCAEALASDFGPGFEFANAFADPERSEHALEHCIGGGDDQLRLGLARLQAVQRCQSLGADRQRGAGTIVGE